MSLIKILLVLPLAVFGYWGVARADEDISLDSAKAQLAQAQSEYNEELSKASNIKAEVEKNTAKAIEAQNIKMQKQDTFNKIAVYVYKNGVVLPFIEMISASSSLIDFFHKLDYANILMNKFLEAMQQQEEARNNYEESVRQLNLTLDLYNASVLAANNKLARMQDIVNEASEKLNAKPEDIGGGGGDNPPLPGPTPGEWKSGVASAYGGVSDPGAGSTTATGEAITESSMGVSIPMSLPDYRSLFGHTVQIKIGDKVVIGRINDCGGLDGGARALDVQPGIFHAFGYGSCQAWGVRNIEYVIM